MNILILQGDPQTHSPLQAYLQAFERSLCAKHHTVKILPLASMDFKGCTGCWGCFLKTPGECVKRDDSRVMCRAVMHSDLVILASPMFMGFTSSILKRGQGTAKQADEEDIAITTRIWSRTARNLKSRLIHSATTISSPEELSNAFTTA